MKSAIFGFMCFSFVNMLGFFWDPNDQDPNKPIENNKRKKQLISEASYHDKH